ncbi:MAG: isoprenoid biosynthesis protein ElbB [Bdellovibrionales bacterium RIFOXYD1_FULL_53_11]|nr:MAG: isoprenoid biosynthesis protein ElbB [Bdellovibrionales bacterium RIFOXYD1_FULL_53_11]
MNTAGTAKKAAVILCGSGFKDGSEIRESVATLWALSSLGIESQCFAPDADQADVINCLSGEPMNEKRNMLVESARIARGKVLPLHKLIAADFDMLLLPGGFGAAKNLCTFATEGAGGTVIPDLRRAIESFFNARKPIGAICIAPVLVAMSLPGKNLDLTLGPRGSGTHEVEKLGHRTTVRRPDECNVDIPNRIVTAPAYMHGDAKLREVFEGIRKAVEETVRLA